MASMASHHAEWLSLMEVSGPFMSVPVLKDALPNGLDAHDPYIAAEVRASSSSGPTLMLESRAPGRRSIRTYFAFVQFVMHEVLGFDDDVMVWGGDYMLDWAGPAAGCVIDGDQPVMPVAVFWPDTPVDEILAELGTESASRTGWSSI